MIDRKIPASMPEAKEKQKHMRFGVCNWTLDEDLEVTAPFLSQAGFDGLELKGDLARYTPPGVMRILEEHNLRVLSLTPENVDLAHPDPAVRASALDYYLQLGDYAHAVGAPLISCHGMVGRVRALSDQQTEYEYFLAAVKEIARHAASRNLGVVLEVLNRYESHLINTAEQAVRAVRAVNEANVGILLDAYHMNIEERDLGRAVVTAGDQLFLFHAADSNRQALGRGHTDWRALLTALKQIDYQGDVIFECTAQGPDPFTPVKAGNWRDQVRLYAGESLRHFRSAWAVPSLNA